MNAQPCMARAAMSFLIVMVALLLDGCAAFRQFGPSVEVQARTPSEYISLKRGDILTTGEPSAATLETVRVAGLDEGPCAKSTADCISALTDSPGIADERKLSALAELWLQQALSLPATDPDARLNAWLEAARHAYAYLFYSERTPGQRAFADRQTQVRDYYNLAVQESAALLFRQQMLGAIAFDEQLRTRVGPWTIRADVTGLRLPGDDGELKDLVAASSLSFTGLRSTYRRDGFGAEMVAVTDSDSVTVIDADSLAAQKRPRRALPVWSEMPSPPTTVLLHFAGTNQAQVLSTHEVLFSIHDPYQTASLDLHGQQVPLAANFTAGYGLWLAHAGFSTQSLRSLFGREHGIAQPHLYLMQPYDPDRRILLMVHGLASSPEAWVNVGNELMGDEALRRNFQIWQFYYPTNIPIAVNHHAIREALHDALHQFDPQGTARASRDMVLVGHSMGGILSRLLVSSSGDVLSTRFIDRPDIDEARRARIRERVGPMLQFDPLPFVSRAVFIAAPHRGTEFAGGRLGRWLSGMVHLPMTLLARFGDIMADLSQTPNDRTPARLSTSIDNLDKTDPFIQTAAQLPISASVRYHSIIGNERVDTPLATSSDGVVPYWSSHLDGATSERVIHSGHSVQETAQAIIELRRILHEDIDAPAPPAESPAQVMR